MTLTEKPLFEFDLELPLGLEGAVSSALQDWLETFLSDTLGDALVWPERIVVPLPYALNPEHLNPKLYTLNPKP